MKVGKTAVGPKYAGKYGLETVLKHNSGCSSLSLSILGFEAAELLLSPFLVFFLFFSVTDHGLSYPFPPKINVGYKCTIPSTYLSCLLKPLLKVFTHGSIPVARFLNKVRAAVRAR
jgi:hypothetical protein